MSKGPYYWAGQGVYHYEGKDYKRGEKLPDAVPQETLDALLKKGKVSTSPLAAPQAPQADGELVALRERVSTLTAECDGLKTQLTAAQEMIKELTAAQLKGPAPAAPAAGPKK